MSSKSPLPQHEGGGGEDEGAEDLAQGFFRQAGGGFPTGKPAWLARRVDLTVTGLSSGSAIPGIDAANQKPSVTIPLVFLPS